ncbi:MAG: glycosyltransferase family 2 protein [Gaiellales bacterium]
MTEAVFWSAVGLIAYTYLGFPLLVLARGALRPRPVAVGDGEPRISVLVAAHDEALSIGRKLENLLGLDYPADRLEIVVASDGSGDGTDAIVRELAGAQHGRQIHLLSLPRQGKAPALTAAAEVAEGDVLVFSDANSMFAPDALRKLVGPFADPSVGGVAGDQRYLSGAGDGSAAGERSYWSLDRALKVAESRGGNVISATGAIYAIRRELFRPVLPGVTDDFYTSTGVIAQGRRLVFAADAAAYEPVAPSSGIEFGRKVRVITRGLRGVLARRQLLDPFRHGFYAVQLVSHKVLRRLMFVPLAAMLATSALLWSDGPFWVALTSAQAALYGAGLAGIALGGTRVGRSKLLALPAFFCLANAACAAAVWNIARGRRIELWQPERDARPPAAGVELPAGGAGRPSEGSSR